MQTRRPGDLVPIEPEECLRLLGSVGISRVGFVTNDGPDVLPVNHLVHDGRIVFRSAPGSKLGIAAAGARVAVEADDISETTNTGWSVVAYGEARIVTDPERLEALHLVDFAPWASPDLRDHWIEIDPDRVTGRRLDDH